MRSSVIARLRRGALPLLALVLAFGLIVPPALADESKEAVVAPLASELASSRTVLVPASAMSDAAVTTITSGTVALSSSKGGAKTQDGSVVRTTYVARGCVYVVDKGTRSSTLVNGTNAELTENDHLIIPSALVLDGASYPVRSIAASALSGSHAILVALSSEVASIDKAAFEGADALQAFYVAPSNETYLSSDGCLYEKDPFSLRLIPEGRLGTIRVPSGAEVDPEEFSHCLSVEPLSADVDGAASLSGHDVLYIQDKDDAPYEGVAGSPIEDEPLSFDPDAIHFDDDAFAPITLPFDTDEAFAGSEPADGDDRLEGDADSTTSPSAPAGEPIEGMEEAGTSLEEEGSSSSDEESFGFMTAQPSYLVSFDANGGEAGHLPDSVWTTSEGSMPSLSDQHIAAKIPVRDKYVFMGFYDGSDYTKANRYYNPDFTQDGCTTEYAFGADGLTLYAGWAPTISVDVPTSVSVAVGSNPSIDAPSSTTSTIKNMSPWDVKATSLTWDTTTMQGSTADLDDMFGNLSSLRFSIALADDPDCAGSVAPGATTTQAEDIGFIALAKGSVATPTERSFQYTVRMNEATVEKTDVVSNTSLITVFEATDAPEEAVRSTILFDVNDDGTSDYYLDPMQATYGERPNALVMPDGSPFKTPEYYGHTFMGFFDKPLYTQEGAVQYFDADGAAVRDWDKTTATVLYAGWHTESGTVVFDGNGGFFDGDASKKQLVKSVEYGQSVADALGEGFVPTAMFRSGGRYITSNAWFSDPIAGTQVNDFSQVVMDDVDEPIVFYAHWSASEASVPVTFVANGMNAKVEGEDRITKNIVLGQFMGSLPEAVRPGFTFDGWYTAAVGGVKIEDVPPTLAAMTLYAHWIGNEVTVSWDTGGWNVADPPSATYTYTDEDTINVGYPSGGAYDAMDRGAGFIWNGWYAKAEDGTASGEKVTTATRLPVVDTTYHAFWDADLTWSMNDGTDAFETTKVTLSTSVPVRLPASDPVRDGYVFDGYYTAASGGTKVPADSVVSEPTTFYAHWTGVDYAVAIDKNANDAVAGTTEVQVKQGDPLPTLTELPVREGYELVGFFDTAAGQGGTMYYTAAGTSVRAWDKAGDGSLYARWINGSTGGTAPTDPPIPVSPGGTDPTDPFPGDYPKPGEKPSIIVTPDAGSNIFAKASDEAGVAKTLLSGAYRGSLMWNSIGETPAASDMVVVTLSVYEPDAGNALAEVKDRFASNTGKHLLGFTAPSCGSFISWEELSSGTFLLKVKGSDLAATSGLPSLSLRDGALVVVYGDAPVRPVDPSDPNGELEEGSGVTNSFDGAGGTFGNGAASIMVSSVVGERLNMPEEEPIRSGFDFDGWWTAPDGGTEVDGATLVPNKATTYYAHWKGAAFKVTLDANAEGIAGYPVTVDVQYGVAMPSISVGMPSREGYVFAGFFDVSAAAGGKLYYTASGSSARVWDKAEGATLYARWIDGSTGSAGEGEELFPPAPVAGPTIEPTPQSGSTIRAEALDHKNTSRTLLDGTYHGSVIWEGVGSAAADSERVVVRVDSYVPSTVAPLQGALSAFEGEGRYLLGFEVVSTGSFVSKGDLASGAAFKLLLMGSDLSSSAAAPSVGLKQGSLRAVYADSPIDPDPGPDGPIAGSSIAITYDAGEGSFDGARYKTVFSKMGETLSKPTDPVRAGYVFEGWFTQAIGGIGAPNETPSANATYHAHWHARTYTITFDANGGAGGTESVNAVFDSPLPSGVAMPARADHRFIGYFDTKDATGGKLYYSASGAGVGIYDKAGDATLYARWIDESTGGIPGEPGTDPFPGIDPDDPKPGQGPSIVVTPDTGNSTIFSTAVNHKGTSESLLDGTYLGALMWASDAEAPKADDDVVVVVDSYEPSGGNDLASVAKRFEGDGKYLLGFQVASTGSFIGWDELRTGTSFSFVVKGTNLATGVTAPSVTLKDGTLRAVYTSTPPDSGGNTEVVNTFDATLGAFAAGNRFEVKSSIAGGTLSLPSKNPTRAGYEFAGWWTAQVGGTRVDVAPAPSAPTASTTYYARWKGEPVLVTWAANTPSDAEHAVQNVPGTIAMERGQRLMVKYGDALPEPSLVHFRFDGWYTEASGGAKVSPATILSADSTTFYAHWTWAPNPCTITFDVATNGGVGGPGTASALYKDELPAVSGVPTKTGHSFVGFYDAATGGICYYDESLAPQKSAWDKEGNAATLYAQFTANVYDVFISANQGEGTISSIKATYGQPLPAPADYMAPVRAGYTLVGFYDTSAPDSGTLYLNADGSSAHVWDKASYGYLHARWQANTYAVTFDGQGGTGGTAEASVTYHAALPSITLPARPGYSFGGYYAEPNGAGTCYYDGSGAATTFWDKPSDAILYAKWTGNTITITWDRNGGGGPDIPSTSAVYSESAKLPMPSADPEATGYTFAGWFAKDHTQVTADTPLPSTDTTYWAHWTANKYTVSFVRGTGSDTITGGQTANVTATYGAAMPPITTTAPVRAGFDFMGWYDGGDYTKATQYYTAAGASARTWNKASDATLYGGWKPHTYTIAFNGNGATSGSTASMAMTYAVAKNLTANGFVRTGYTFAGWTANSAGTGTVYSDGQRVNNFTAIDKNVVTLYAKWTPKTSALTFNANGGSGTMPTGKKATYGSAMPSIGSTKPTKTGCTFLGYYDAATGGTQYYTAALASARNWNKDTTSGVTLYAHWDLIIKPSASTESAAGDFYIYNGDSSNGAVGFYTISNIKTAANDIAVNGVSSDYYPVYRNFMNAMDDPYLSKSSSVYGFSKGWDTSGGYFPGYMFIRIAGLRHDDLASGYQANNKFGQSTQVTKAGLTFETVRVAYILTGVDIAESPNWGSSKMRTELNSGDKWGYIPSVIKQHARPVLKKYFTTTDDATGALRVSTDTVFLPSYIEVVGSWMNSHGSYLKNEGFQYEFYAHLGKLNQMSANDALVRLEWRTNDKDSWLLRSLSPGTTERYLTVGPDGDPFLGGGGGWGYESASYFFCF